MLNPKEAQMPLRAILGNDTSAAQSLGKVFDLSRHTLDPDIVDVAREELSAASLEELAALIRVDRTYGTDYVAQTLRVDSRDLMRILEAFEQENPELSALWRAAEVEDYASGLEASTDSAVTAQESDSEAFKAEGAPTFFSLVDASMPLVREQGQRSTCTAFVAAACVEYHAAVAAGIREDLSEQFLFWRTLGMSGGSRDLNATFAALAAGICRETDWPYVSTVIPGNETHHPPPAAAVQNATVRAPSRRLDPRSINVLKGVLLSGRLIAIGFPIYRSWYANPHVRHTGNIGIPPTGEQPSAVGGHAVNIVGYADNSLFAGGGYFIVRNCWDSRWGVTSPFGPGYGTMPYKFITDYNWDAWCIG